MKQISVLGSGWLGLPLARHLSKLGHQIKASTRTHDRLASLSRAGLTPFLIDIDADNIDTDKGASSALDAFLQSDLLIINITSKQLAGFERLLDAIRNTPLKQLLFVSSTSVYPNINATLSEHDPCCDPPTALVQIERLIQTWQPQQTTLLRLGGLIGYSRHPGRFFRSGKTVKNPEAPVNLIHRDDCIGIITAIIEQGAWGEILNGCADTHPTKRVYYTHAAAAVGAPPPRFEASVEGTRANGGKRVCNRKLKQLLHYTFQYPDIMQLDRMPFDEPSIR